mmetsp:Transcript_15388/g.26512  ORF Transcript_15388/g.26512 Transcript_15388/m.26512 type:complete len:542 (+) Transcript_15388:177-1802(+)|eukprot:CAMPEP_0168584118 /NCGR_PEP_ID=MMETSP0420-20121227/2964_1 /TAXON_ID=498008 /ORGANISM="Pessonella sp." /LENGTH=541 /DNA_ID=CAMNT_0008618889 /DNA_START=145 /DNA_END=1770 /DNA_ORIENTATION=-
MSNNQASKTKANPQLATHYGVSRSCKIAVSGDHVSLKDGKLISNYIYQKNHVEVSPNGDVVIAPRQYKYQFETDVTVPKVGVLLVGWGGNNGSTLTAGLLANKLNMDWNTKSGKKSPNYYGSLTQATTIRVGSDDAGRDIHVPFNSILPMVHPNDLVIGGWDISKTNLADAMERAEVLDFDLQRQLRPLMEKMVPMPSIYYPDFIAANQSDRADNVLKTESKQADLERLRKDIRDFKTENKLDRVIVVWTANTERFVDVSPELNGSADALLNSIANNEKEVSASQIFAVASILEGCPYINGSPQNTLTAGVVDLAMRHDVFVGGDDFKSGQTKVKSVLADFLVSAGIKLEAIVSYNHLGNNDGKNLSAPKQFRSKEISKSNVVDDVVAMNHLLYAEDEHPDHVVVIKYVPTVKDSKRALDEYTSSIFMNGANTLVLHNTCEDSLLATPLIVDLVVLTELFTRVRYRDGSDPDSKFARFHPVLSVLAYLLKAPMVPAGTPVVNALAKQQRCITNILSALAGLPPDNDMSLEHKTVLPKSIPF